MNHAGTPLRNQAGSQVLLDETRVAHHPRCLLCSAESPFNPKVDFRVQEPGKVHASFMCRRPYQSYPGMLHGGLISAVLDAAMTNCLFSMGVVAITAELMVRYLTPVRIECEAEVTASLDRSTMPMYYVSAELSQEGKVCARATAKFMDKEWAATMGRSDPHPTQASSGDDRDG